MSHPFRDPEVAAAFAQFADPIRSRLLLLRDWVFVLAEAHQQVGSVTETLKWGQPSYLTLNPKSGTTIRLGTHRAHPGASALFFHCQTSLIADARGRYGELLRFEGQRAIILDPQEPVPESMIKDCLTMALTYHVRHHVKASS